MTLECSMLYVKDFVRMREFYGGVLQARPINTEWTDAWALFEVVPRDAAGFPLHGGQFVCADASERDARALRALFARSCFSRVSAPPSSCGRGLVFCRPFRPAAWPSMNPCIHFLHKSYSNWAFAASDSAWTCTRVIARPERKIESSAFLGIYG